MAGASIVYFRKMQDILSSSPDLYNSASGICYQACCAMAGTAAGGILLGPGGALVGGACGAVYGYRNVHQYRPLINALNELSDEERQNLTNQVQELVGAETVEALIAYCVTETGRDLLINVVRTFLANRDKFQSG